MQDTLLQMRFGDEIVKSTLSKNLLKMEAKGFNLPEYFVPVQAKALCSITVVFLLNSPNHLHGRRRQTIQQVLLCRSACAPLKGSRRGLCVIGVPALGSGRIEGRISLTEIRRISPRR